MINPQLPATPKSKKITKERLYILRTPEISRVSLFEEIRIDSAVGSPVVATTQRSAYISYAELKYPIPSAPRIFSIGIL